MFYSENEPSLSAQEAIRSQLTNILKDHVLVYDYGMTEKDLEWFNNPKIGFYSKDIRSGKDSYKEIKTILGTMSGFLIYMFIFLFGGQVMKSVSEEKTNRIVEAPPKPPLPLNSPENAFNPEVGDTCATFAVVLSFE